MWIFLGLIFYFNWGLAVMWIVLWCHAMLWTGHTHKKESFPESISAESVAAFSNLTSVVYKLWPLKGQGVGTRTKAMPAGANKKPLCCDPLFWQTLQMISWKKANLFPLLRRLFPENFLGCSKRPLQRLDCKGQAQKV